MPRDYDTQSVRSDRPRNFTTVRRYKVPDRDDEDRYETDVNIIDREDDFDRRPSRNVREIKVTRELERAPSPPSPVRGWRVEREDPRRGAPYELERYSRETEYMSREQPERLQPIIIQQQAPAPIIIREAAPVAQEIVIREERREEPRYEMPAAVVDRRSEDARSVANRSMVRRDPSPESDDENYYYRRTTRQVARRNDDRNDGREEERDSYRRDIDPRDQVAPRYAEDRRGGYHSDDEYYYKKTTEEWGGGDDAAHKRHLAEGAVAGLGAAYLLQSHRKKQGENAGGAGQLVGGAAIGAIGAEVLSRVRNRSQSRGRGNGGNDEGTSNLAKVGAVAVLGALAGYAISRQRKSSAGGERQERRSRSRRRRSSVSRGVSRSGSDDRGRGSPDNRATIAKAGLASAAVAGLVDRVRSRSRGGRSRSLGRQALPAAAAGLGGAALAGLYTRNKEKQREREAEDSSPVRRSRSRTRRRARSRSQSAPNFREPGAPGDQQNLVVYGGDPIPPADQYARSRSRADSYYSEPGGRGGRGSPDTSQSMSPRQRSRSRQRNEGAAGAGLSGAAAAASVDEAGRRRERKRQERERRRMEEERNETPPAWGPYSQAAPQALPAPQYNNQYFPQTTYFPPPPNANSPVPVPVSQNYNYNNYAQYNPTDFSAQAPTPAPGNQQHPGAGGSIGGGQWYNPPGGQPYPGHYNVSRAFHTPEPRDLGSLSSNLQPKLRRCVLTSGASDGMSESSKAVEGEAAAPRPRGKSVQFNLSPMTNGAAPEGGAAVEESQGERGRGGGRRARNEERRSQSADDADHLRYSHQGRQRGQDDDKRRRAPSPASDDSGETVMLPDRFDSQGRRKQEGSEDRLAEALADVLNGRGAAGHLFHTFAGDFLGGGRTSRR